MQTEHVPKAGTAGDVVFQGVLAVMGFDRSCWACNASGRLINYRHVAALKAASAAHTSWVTVCAHGRQGALKRAGKVLATPRPVWETSSLSMYEALFKAGLGVRNPAFCEARPLHILARTETGPGLKPPAFSGRTSAAYLRMH